MEESNRRLSVRSLLRGSIKRLAHVYRYSSLPVIRRESVAEHTAFISIFALCIAKDLQSRGFKVDEGLLLKSALLHDIDESLSGDFLRCVKYGVPGLKGLLDEASVKFVRSIEDQLGVQLLKDWAGAKNEATLEGWIVSIADLMGVVSYLEEELALGNRHVAYLLEEIDRYFADIWRTCYGSPYSEALLVYISEVRGVLDVLKGRLAPFISGDDFAILPPEGAYGKETK